MMSKGGLEQNKGLKWEFATGGGGVFWDVYNLDTQEQVGLMGFGGEQIGRAEVEVRIGKLKI